MYIINFPLYKYVIRKFFNPFFFKYERLSVKAR